MSDNKIDEIENEFIKILKRRIESIEAIKNNDENRKIKLIKVILRELELEIKITRLKVKTIEYKIDNKKMREKYKGQI
jgi:hypothetical protein